MLNGPFHIRFRRHPVAFPVGGTDYGKPEAGKSSYDSCGIVQVNDTRARMDTIIGGNDIRNTAFIDHMNRELKIIDEPAGHEPIHNMTGGVYTSPHRFTNHEPPAGNHA